MLLRSLLLQSVACCSSISAVTVTGSLPSDGRPDPALPESPTPSAAPAAFQFYPAAVAEKQAYWNASYNSWGGSVVNDSGTYHLFMSGMAGKGSTLSSWTTVSEVVRAVSSAPA